MPIKPVKRQIKPYSYKKKNGKTVKVSPFKRTYYIGKNKITQTQQISRNFWRHLDTYDKQEFIEFVFEDRLSSLEKEKLSKSNYDDFRLKLLIEHGFDDLQIVKNIKKYKERKLVKKELSLGETRKKLRKETLTKLNNQITNYEKELANPNIPTGKRHGLEAGYKSTIRSRDYWRDKYPTGND